MTKIEKITEDLRNRVRSGEWNSIQTLPSRAILSTEYGVATGTVSLVLRNLEEEGLVRILPRKGVIVTESPSTPPRQPPHALPTIGLRGTYLRLGVPQNRGYIGQLVNQLLEAAQAEDYPLLILQKRQEDERLTREKCEALGLAGMIYLGGDAYEEAVRLRLEGFPVISANRPALPTPLNYVDCDHVSTLRDIVRRFAEAGHQRIAIVLASTTMPGAFDQLRPHFINALHSHRLHYDASPYWVSLANLDDGGETNSAQQLGTLLSLPEPPTAIFCWNYYTLKLVTEALTKRNLCIPDDVSLAYSPVEAPEEATMSGYTYSHQTFGRMLLSELVETIKNPFHYTQKELPFIFIDRGSIAAPPRLST